MVMRSVFWSRIGRIVPCAALALLTATSAQPAQARYRAHVYRHHASHAPRVRSAGFGIPPRSGIPLSAFNASYAAMVVDANSGRTLFAVNEDAPRHPASITKVMTLFMLFEELEQGHMRLDSDLTVSSHAAAQSPTKLGLRPGSTISVENAIKAIVTKSANDMAVAVAENIAGDEATFAAAMTRKARSLGMTHTAYYNASGLPDMRQITTARDLTILGRAIRERFPRYYHYFSTPSFTYAGSYMPNHNHLLGRVDGMDGIKTGYTAASGFNLLTSVNRDGRHIVSVVLGGRTAASRDRVMQTLIEGHIEEASSTPSTRIADSTPVEEPAATPVHMATPQPVDRQPPRRPAELARQDDDAEEPASDDQAARISFAAQTGPAETRPSPGFNLIAPEMGLPPTDPSHRMGSFRQADAREQAQMARDADLARPQPARASAQILASRPSQNADLLDKPRPAFIAGAPKPLDSARLPTALRNGERRMASDGSTNRRSTGDTATPSTLRWVTGPQPARSGARDGRPGPSAQAEAEPAVTGSIDRAPTPEETRAVRTDEHASPAPASRGGWVIQIGATDDDGKAHQLLARAQSEGRSALASARPFTEKVQRGESTLYRARFAGLDPTEAEAACKTLKRSGFACFATHN